MRENIYVRGKIYSPIYNVVLATQFDGTLFNAEQIKQQIELETEGSSRCSYVSGGNGTTHLYIDTDDQTQTAEDEDYVIILKSGQVAVLSSVAFEMLFTRLQ